MKKSKIIGFDLDDIILDFNNSLRGYYNEMYQTDYKREHMTSFYLDKVWGLPQNEMADRIRRFYNHEVHWATPPVPGAVESIKKLSGDHKLIVITAKPETIRQKTEEWLSRHFSNVFESLHFTNHFIGDAAKRKKSEVCLELGVEVFVEDALHNAVDVAGAGIPVLLLDAPWNQGEIPSGVTRVFSWDEIVEKLNS